MSTMQTDLFPGRGDLRISLTTRCNYNCLFCHGEGNVKPWEHCTEAIPTISEIGLLIGKATEFGARRVRFSGGEPSQFHDIIALLSETRTWALQYPMIVRWGLNSNGVAFVAKTQLQSALLDSAITDLVVGIDSVRVNEKSKPSSTVGMSGLQLFEKLKLLATVWMSQSSRKLKFNVVYTGKQDNDRVLEVIEAGRSISADVGVIELSHSSVPNLRQEFENFRSYVADLYQLQIKKVELLDQMHLFDEYGHDPIRFYQDHCKDNVVDADECRIGCKACRAIHLRVGPTETGFGAVPCPFENATKMVPLTNNGHIISSNFNDALQFNGLGPEWAKGTKYEQSL